MKKIFFSLMATLSFISATQAKIWRVNNNPGVVADFTTFNAAATSASVQAGDTLHIEASAISYSTASFTLAKRLTVIGVGYFLDTANVSLPGNPGLQQTLDQSRLDFFNIGTGAIGSKFLGVGLSITFVGSVNSYDVLIERCLLHGNINFSNANHSGITIRKNFFQNTRIEGTQGTFSNFIIENNIFNSTFAYINLPLLSGTNNIFRNNSIRDMGVAVTLANCYVANNIFGNPTNNFTNCTIKNNLFSSNQSLPGTATNNQINVNMSNVYVGGTTGSFDSRAQLRAGSPAIAAGLTIGAVVTPDCGAFGATDPYRLSGIPNIPSIYTLNVPISVPSGTTSMNVTFSTRNNN